MNRWIKLGSVAAVSLIVGLAGGAAGMQSLHSSPGDIAARELLFNFERLATREGAPKSPESIQKQQTQLLALTTVVAGQQFAGIRDPQVRDETVRIAKLVDSTTALQVSPESQTSMWAAESRRCIIEKATDPAAVATCVNSAKSAPRVGDAGDQRPAER